jgi:hypothetical protein
MKLEGLSMCITVLFTVTNDNGHKREAPKELRERMYRFDNVNWSELIRKFIEEVVARYEAEEIIKRVEEDLKDVPELPLGTVSRWLRSDGESH